MFQTSGQARQPGTWPWDFRVLLRTPVPSLAATQPSLPWGHVSEPFLCVSHCIRFPAWRGKVSRGRNTVRGPMSTVCLLHGMDSFLAEVLRFVEAAGRLRRRTGLKFARFTVFPGLDPSGAFESRAVVWGTREERGA